MSAPFRVGLVGAGAQASHHRAPSLLALRDDEVHIVAIADPNVDAAHRLADSLCDPAACAKLVRAGYDVHPLQADERPTVHASCDDMLARQKLDAVVNVTPHRAHYAAAIAALKVDLHVLSEKPTADDARQAEHMVDLANANGRILVIGYQTAPVLRRALLGPGGRDTLGSVLAGRAWWIREDGIPAPPEFWDNLATTGVGRDLLPHLIAMWVAAEGVDSIVAVRDATGSRDAGRERFGDRFVAFDTITANLELSTGRLLNVVASWCTDTLPHDQAGFVLYGSSGAHLEVPIPVEQYEGYVPTIEAYRAVARGDGVGFVRGALPSTFVEMFYEQARTWVDACRGFADPPLTAEATLVVERVVDEINRRAIATSCLAS